MQNVRLNVQIDFDVGDVIVPGPRLIHYPVFLGGDMIELLAYPVESAITEKLQAMAALGNERLRKEDGRSRPHRRIRRDRCRAQDLRNAGAPLTRLRR